MEIVVETPKITDSIEKISSINKQLYDKYNRHHVLKDTVFLFDPTIDPKSYFSHVIDIDGNGGTTFKVSLGFENFVLEKLPHYVWHSEDEYLKDQFEKWTTEVEVSYDLEDSNISNIRNVHHMFIKLMYNPRQQKKYYCFWTLKEYFEGDSIFYFDYGAECPNEYFSYGKHKEGRLVSIKAAKKFTNELITVFIQLLKKGYIPYRFNDSGIIIRYKNDNIEWKFVEYLYFKKRNPNSGDISGMIDSFKSMLCWRMCGYTNYSNHKLSPDQHHPFWTGLNSLMEEKYEYFAKIGKDEYQKYQNEGKRWDQNFPILSHEQFIKTFETFLEYVKNS